MQKTQHLKPVKIGLYLMALFILCSCSDNGNRELLEKLKTAVEAEEVGASGYKVIPMESLTDFEWDMLYFFDQNSNSDDISDEIGFKWEGPGVPNLQRRLLFVEDGKVVSYVDYNYKEFPLYLYGCNEDRWVYPRNRTRFASFKYCNEEKQELYTFIPVECVNNLQELMRMKCPEST
jgi:hypothetical protein